ncbi:mCG146556, partial [Mus musculus]
IFWQLATHLWIWNPTDSYA